MFTIRKETRYAEGRPAPRVFSADDRPGIIARENRTEALRVALHGNVAKIWWLAGAFFRGLVS